MPQKGVGSRSQPEAEPYRSAQVDQCCERGFLAASQPLPCCPGCLNEHVLWKSAFRRSKCFQHLNTLRVIV